MDEYVRRNHSVLIIHKLILILSSCSKGNVRKDQLNVPIDKYLRKNHSDITLRSLNT